MNNLRAAAFAALIVSNASLATVAGAAEIELRSPDGAIELTGTLLGFDGDFFRIDTSYGVLTVDAARVICRGAACPGDDVPKAHVTLAGADVMAETLLPALVEAYAVQAEFTLEQSTTEAGARVFRFADTQGATGGAEFTLRSSTAAEAFVDLVSDQADMVLAMRDVSPFESAIGVDAGLGSFRGPYQVRVLARDALVPGVNASNPVRDLTLDQLVGVFSGELVTWSELGGPDTAITAHLTDPGHGVGEAFVRQVLDPVGKALSPDIVIHPSPDDLALALEQDPFAIGVTAFSNLGNARHLRLTGACGFGLAAEERRIEAGDYPLTLPMYLYLPERRLPGVARDFLAFLRSPEALDVVRDAGFVAPDFNEIPLALQGVRLANAIRAAGPEVTLGDLQRLIPLFSGKQLLSLTFRFLDGSTTLDLASRANVIVLASALEAGAFDGREVTFAGFSDGAGSAGANLRLSERRAEAVRAAVVARVSPEGLAGVGIDTAGYGEALPMACDDTPWGRQVNRRVEVWVSPGAGSE